LNTTASDFVSAICRFNCSTILSEIERLSSVSIFQQAVGFRDDRFLLSSARLVDDRRHAPMSLQIVQSKVFRGSLPSTVEKVTSAAG